MFRAVVGAARLGAMPRKTEDKELMRGVLAPVAWLKEDASQMVNVARKCLPTEQEQRKAKNANGHHT